MRKLIVVGCLLLSACTTPETMLRNEKTGQVARCGGVAAVGIMYTYTESVDKKCVEDYLAEGFHKR